MTEQAPLDSARDEPGAALARMWALLPWAQQYLASHGITDWPMGVAGRDRAQGTGGGRERMRVWAFIGKGTVCILACFTVWSVLRIAEVTSGDDNLYGLYRWAVQMATGVAVMWLFFGGSKTP